MQETGNNPFHQEKNILSIRLCANGFSFFVFNPIRQSIIYQLEKELSSDYSYFLNLIQAFRDTDFLDSGFEKVYIIAVNERYTFIPLEFFDEHQKDSLFEYNFSRQDNELIEYNVLVNNSCAVLFGVDKDVSDFLNSRYPAFEIYSQVSLLTEYFSLRSRSVRLKQMFVYFRPACMDIYCFDRGFLTLVNSYNCNSVTDYSYYILLIWKQLGMNQLNDELSIAGHVDVKEELVNMLSKFVNKIIVMPAIHPKDTINANLNMIPYDVGALLSLKESI